MKSEVEAIKKEALYEIEKAESAEDLEKIRIKFLGKKGRITLFAREIGKLPQDMRPAMGRAINSAKDEIKKALASKKIAERREVWFDETVPPIPPQLGRKHPITQTMEEIVNIFCQMGFSIEEGPEIERTDYNFDALNIPPHHPARDMHDTFYITDDLILRTHTSPVQIRVMKRERPPIRMIAPGRVYRRDSDISHSPMFHQVEGLLIDKKITFSDLKGVLSLFLHQIFGEKAAVRFRPSYFPFTEPSAEVDIGCILCRQKGCRVCKNTGWLEILGAGMVDPHVLINVGYDPEVYTGFAFGLGVERVAMLKYRISDIRLFFENDMRFLSQF
jgi:phenylalanyl-tRNA synthetase alpha chain